MASWKILSALALLCPLASYATSYTWTNTSPNIWDLNTNWNPTTGYPGSTGTTDTATFNLTPGVTVTQSGTIPTIHGITYASPSGNYTIAGSVGVEFVGTAPFITNNLGSQTISAPIVLNSTGNSLTITVATVGNNLTLSGGVTDLGTTSVIVVSGAGTFINSGSLVANGNITLNSGSIVQNASTMTAGGTFTIAGSTVTSNNSTTPPFTCISEPVLSGATVNVTSGNITLDSACGTLATAGVVGTTLESSTNVLAISGGTLNVTNEATITATGAGATGGMLSGVGVTVSGGGVNLTNTGTISGNANDTGVLLYSNTLGSGNPMTFSGGTVIATNNGSVTMGNGALVQSGQLSVNNPINVSGGTLTVENTFNLTSTTAATGASLVGGTLTVSAGALNLENTGDLTSFPGQGTNGTIAGNITVSGGAMTLLNGTAGSPNTTGSLSGSSTIGGVEVSATGNFIQSGGTFTNENTGTLAVGTGAFLNIAGTSTLSTAGTFTNLNSGNVTAPAVIGSYFDTAGNLGLGAGVTVSLSNSGTVTAIAPGSVGSFTKALTITDSGSIVNLNNSGNVSGYTGQVGVVPGTIGTFFYSLESIAMTGGTWTALNTGTIPAGGTGVQIECHNFTLGGNASVTMTNDVTANVSTTTGYGCQFVSLNPLVFPSGSTSVLSLINNQALSSSGAGTGAIVQLGSSMAGGTLNLTNTNTVGPSTAFNGVLYLIEAGTFAQTGGTVNMTNSGTVSSASNFSDGVGMKVTGTPAMNLTGGSFNMTNTGTINSASAAVSGVLATNTGLLTIGGTANVTVTNNGSVSSATVAGIGCQLSGLGITVNGGALNLINNGTISGVAGNIGVYLYNSSTGPMVFSGGTFTGTNNSVSVGSSSGIKIISGPISGSPAPVVVDGGTFTLTNIAALNSTDTSASVYLQGSSLTVSAGSLTFSNSGNLSAFTGMATNAVFSNITVTGGVATLLNTGSLSGSGIGVQATASTGTTMTGGIFNVSNTGNLSGSATGAALVADVSFNQTGGTFTVSNSGANSGSGNASYIQSPAITISGGTFNNPNALVAATTVTINAGGLLQSGTATVPGVFDDLSFGSTTNVTNNGGTFVSGTLDPTPGQTTIAGVFTQNAGTYTVVIGNLNLPSNQGISFLTVNGTGPTNGVVNLDGGILNIVPATGFNIATDIPAGFQGVQFIQASTVIHGGFSPQKIFNYVPGLGELSYETLAGNQGWLLFHVIPPSPPVPLTPSYTPLPYQPITVMTINRINTFLGRELLRMQDDFIAMDEEYESVNLKHRKHHQRRRNSHSPSLANLSMPQSPKGSGGSAQTIANPILAADSQLAFVNYPLQTKQERLASEISSGNIVKPWNVYFGPTGDLGSINNKHTQLGAHYRSAGGLAGFDYRFSQVGIGLLVDYENVKAKLHKHGGEFWINQFHATTYTTYVPKSFPQFALNGMLGAGGAWYNIHRNILPHESTKANSRGAEVDALIGAEYLFSHCQFASIPCGLEIAPMLNLQYIYQGVGSYKEHGAGDLDLKFHKQGFQSLRSTLGTWLQYIWSWKNFSFTPLIDIAWQREYLDRNHKIFTTPIAGGPEDSITVFGAGQNTLLAGLDLLFEFYNSYGLEASYDFEYNSLYRNHGFYIGFNARF